MLDANSEQMILKSSAASNHELIKKIEQSKGHYLNDVYESICTHELALLHNRLNSLVPYLLQGEVINQNGLFTEYTPYLQGEYAVYNDGKIRNSGLLPDTNTDTEHDVIICKLKRFDFENALRDVENWRLERLTDFLLELPPFTVWTRKQARKLL